MGKCRDQLGIGSWPSLLFNSYLLKVNQFVFLPRGLQAILLFVLNPLIFIAALWGV